MKQITNSQRATNYLVKIFKYVNEEYFNNELETPTITIQSTVGAYGHVSVSKVWKTDDETASHELNLSADYLNRPIEQLVATMIHECVHIYCMQNGIKDTSNQGVYHNKRFKAEAEKRGLEISRHERYGWTITEPTEETLNFCIKYDLEDVKIHRETAWSYAPISGGKAPTGATPTAPRTRKPSSTRKYVCPVCGNSFRATKDINVSCDDCHVKFIKIQ